MIEKKAVIYEDKEGLFGVKCYVNEEKPFVHISLNETALMELIQIKKDQGYAIVDERGKKEEDEETRGPMLPGYDDLAVSAITLPDELREQETKLIALVRKNDTITKKANEILVKVANVILNEKIQGKKRYPDSKSVEIEVNKRLPKKSAYQEIYSKAYAVVAAQTIGAKQKYGSEKSRVAATYASISDHPGLKIMKQDLIQVVASEIEEDRNKFTNKEIRDAELAIRLRENEDYSFHMSELNGNIESTQDVKIEIDHMKRKMKSLSFLIDIMKIKLRIV